MYALVLQYRNGSAITELTNATNRRFSFYLNRPSEFSCQLSMLAPEATRTNIVAGARELIAYRNGEPLETVFALNRVSVTADETDQRLELGFDGIASYLADALIYGSQTKHIGTALPWSWINTFQTRTGGSYGITQGDTTGTPPSRTRSIEQDASILDEVINLSETGSGFDFAIDTQRRWNEWHTQRGSDRSVVLEYGASVRSFEWEESAAPGDIVTDLRVFGPSYSGPPRVASNSTARTTYGRREASLSYVNESENATVTSGQLQQFADAALNRSAPLVIPQVELITTHPSVAWGSYWLGDTVRFQAKISQYVEIDASYRIIGIHADLDDNDNETIKLDLNAVA